jgi:hypothetical protein
MTYADIAKKISQMDGQELQQDATVWLKETNEYHTVQSIKAVGDLCDALDEGHNIIIVNA